MILPAASRTATTCAPARSRDSRPIMDAVEVRRRRRSGARHLQRVPDPARSGPAAGRDAAEPRPASSGASTCSAGRADRHAVHAACRAGQVLRMPIAHGEGNYYAEPDVVARLERIGRSIFRYTTAAGRGDRRVQPKRIGRRHRRPLQRSAQRRRAHAASGARVRAGGRQRGRSRHVRIGRDGRRRGCIRSRLAR